mmetsp:Transcript_4799/g.8060  ORF Transcript_4799/g.8060 Transcript_4799/m.8060 type:complete len:178 (+) Transcript_4799:319-852(+)
MDAQQTSAERNTAPAASGSPGLVGTGFATLAVSRSRTRTSHLRAAAPRNTVVGQRRSLPSLSAATAPEHTQGATAEAHKATQHEGGGRSVAVVKLVQLEVLAGDEMEGALLELEPDDALLRLQTHHPRRVERGDDGRVLLGATVTDDGLAAPEDVCGPHLLLQLHAGRLVAVVDDHT